MSGFILFLALLIHPLFTIEVQGQQRPQYTQYIFNNFLLNPALSGIENYIDLKTGIRQQWAGLEDAPVTAYLSVHAPIGKAYSSGSPTSFGDAGNNPMSRSFVQDYTAAEPHHGIGLQILSDKTGLYQRTDFTATYAYHLGIAPKLSIAVGVGAGAAQMTLNKQGIKWGDPGDPANHSASASQLNPLLSAGVWLYGARFFAGLSADQLLSTGAGLTTNSSNRLALLIPHYYATAGYKILLGEETALLPSIMVTRVQSQTIVDLNSKISFKGRFWLGASYRSGVSVSALSGLNINHLFNLSYSYDFYSSDLQPLAAGSHEVVLGLLLMNRYKVVCPQNQF